MKCEKCSNEIINVMKYGSGRFCSQSCANRRTFDEKTKIKISQTMKRKGIQPPQSRLPYSKRIHSITALKKMAISATTMADDRYKKYIQEWLEGKNNGMRPNGMKISNHVRRYIFEINNNQCSKCGWKKVNPYSHKIPLEVNHIDGNCENSKIENLELICPNCHSLTSTYRALNNGNGNRKRLKYFGLVA